MDRPIVISDRLSAAGFGLAGMQTRVTEAAQVVEHFRQALTGSAPILITAELAARLPAHELRQAVMRAHPPVAVITDMGGHVPAPDLASTVRRALGVDA